MPRADLLALTDEDLAVLTNRGTLKRAAKELADPERTFEIQESDDGELRVTWCDGTSCRFPAGKTIHEAVCSSGAVGITRHIVRSVLAYQTARQDAATEQSPPTDAQDAPAVAGAPWDPGTIGDDALVAAFGKRAIDDARRLYDKGVVVELIRGAKPTARFWHVYHTVRFMVPGDARYATGDCPDAHLKTWVPLAVWAFRALPAERLAGLISLKEVAAPVPEDLPTAIDALLAELFRDGLNGLAESWPRRIERLEQRVRAADLAWPAELIAELAREVERYASHDARFEPRRIAELTGEIGARMRAIVRNTGAAPQTLIRGGRLDRTTEGGGGRLVGVGMSAQPGRRHVRMAAYINDSESGQVLMIERDTPDPDPQSGQPPRTLDELARGPIVRDLSLYALATSNLIVDSAKRGPDGRLTLPRKAGAVSAYPQAFAWEQLKPPFAVESIEQLRARFDSLPPSYLRARRATDDLHVLATAGVESVGFDAPHQRLVATLVDESGDRARLVHPYYGRARSGFEALAALLGGRGEQVRFVCGHVRRAGRVLSICPTLIVIDDGTRRSGLLPWVGESVVEENGERSTSGESVDESSPVEQWIERLLDALAEVATIGVRRTERLPWRELAETGRRVGFVRLIEPVDELVTALESRAHDPRWDGTAASAPTLELCLLARIALDSRV